ncbi:adenosylcobinamide-GDP ribazoletransferase [Parageobacillus thermoglucosidasius]|uniref:Adenosylcobinamide-GDP ribazoletransferase n=2 Tax=Anoxybacillaceae TaxID=3120669 RepID=A0AB38QV04_PARTM|nr:adenosylcobinamide-GDP ribazoletransferase [Parageobacillus thermoglucosidasius]UOE75228.1 adenosylcobinamide-GDP ribazoletransferase [Parageobacillus thermoglucosidasius]GCD82035.1 adenosylcobinamide-GDP ribazoletransferase [Parageobacillus thermoglucosidasius]GMO00420.1 adenosylcobinamide-GDP ribazoletransferase [Parageobacillus thermoglucosidasius]
MKTVWSGFLLSVQFLTVIPIWKQIDWNDATARWSVRTFPLVGALIGGAEALAYFMFSSFSSVSPLFLALSLLWLSVWLAGGLHADGWMDVSDAFFSYRNIERRQEIMSDSRVGAFAVLSVLCLLSFRFLFMFETICSHLDVFLIVAIPLLSRTAMTWLLIYGKPAKQTGMAAAFRKHIDRHDAHVAAAIGGCLLACVCIAAVSAFKTIVLLMCGTMGAAFVARLFFEKQFGGITGDTLGAFVEGVETWLWLIVWLLR